MATKEFLKGTLRTAIAIFMALAGLAALVAIYSQVKEFREREAAKPFEAVRDWQFDLKERLGLHVHARTKLVSGRLLVAVDVDGYPKYLSDPRNQEGGLILEFLDKDGFKVVTHTVKISEFTTIVGKGGESTGLRHQFDEYFDLERYQQFSRMQVGWNLVEETKNEAIPAKPVLDHCAPNLSRAERLKRLAQYGTVRETGVGEYTASGRSVSFLYDGSLLNCR